MSNHLTPHLAAQIFNTPLLVDQRRLDIMLASIGPRFGLPAGDAVSPELRKRSFDERMAGFQMASEGTKVEYREGYFAIGDVAVIPVMGPLVQRAGQIDAQCTELQSYDGLRRTVAAAFADPRVAAVVYEFDSPGGQVSGAFDTADYLHAQRGKKPTTAHVNEFAASAGYLLASAAADEIVMSRTAHAGSIGVVTAHIDRSKQLAEMGVAVTYIYAGEKKVDGNSTEPLPARVKKDVQASIDDTYRLFVDSVARYRSISAEAVRGTQAAVYSAAEAVAMKLADRIEAFDVELGNQVFSRNGARSSRLTTQSQEKSMTEATQPTSAPAAPAVAAPAAASAPAAEGASLQAERARIKGITGHVEAKGREELAAHLAFDTEMTVEAATALLAKSPKAAAASGSSLAAALDAAGSPGVQPGTTTTTTTTGAVKPKQIGGADPFKQFTGGSATNP